MRSRRVTALAAATLIVGSCPPIGRADPSPQQTAPAFLADAKTPKAETDFIAVIDKARAEFLASRSVDARTGARIGLQIAMHNYLGLTHDAVDWTGVFMGSKNTEDGFRSITIEIAPGIAVSTWDSRFVDGPYDTMVKPFSNQARVIESLTIGQPVVFSADLIGEIIGADDEMVLHPRIVARITKLTGINSPLPLR